ncbi:oligopeptide ABC superfamily ATP binding cassette transporter, binding protein [Sporosarcina newyorkensis 2681]|uniref:Oligopeptide ABC superfamily ATP binding cassette transporter, binding protein n=1 Tax=Sporosarcina newyorkensis 2681 TaxID=1027292 RepID=F9DSA3_9BACL|nr:ABC transporter substrate-binding protein [Sporosarcina newyorkensis]EGQ26240.1 oligopeptide ABC superfamily ATP binding cassette transporter, binding protein [Sporosarcina newyorkensis 2681]
MAKKLFYSMIAIALLVLSACTTTSKPSEDSNTATEKSDSDTLTISLGPDMLTWDIHNHTTTSTEAIHVNVFDYLLMRDTDGEIQPHLAKEWKKVDDLTYEFKMNEDVKFHNGDDLTAEDVKFTLERVAKDETLKSHGDFDTIVEVKVLDPLTFQIITNEPDPMLLSRISRQASGILPKNYIEEVGMDEFLKSPIGSGPYKFKEWKKDNQITLVQNNEYFGKKGEYEEVVFRAIPEDSTRVAELLTDSVDIIANVPPSDWDRINNSDNSKIINGASNRTYMLFLRTQENWPTSDVKVRQAIDYAIDDKALVDTLLDGGGTPTLTRVNPGNVGFEESLYDNYNYDVEKAKKLLEEAGYKDGVTIELAGPTGRYIKDREVMQLIAGMLEEVGIHTEMNLLKWGTFSEMRDQEKFKDGYLIALGSSFFDAGQALDYYGTERSASINGYSNENIDQLLIEANKSLDTDERTKKYQEIQKIASREMPIIPLFQIDQFFGVNNGIDYTPRLDELVYVPDINKK